MEKQDLPSNWVEQVDALRVRLPSAKRTLGAPDPQALIKLVNELIEYLLDQSDYTEVADCVYYAAGAVVANLITEEQAQKWIEDICIVADITPRQAFVPPRATQKIKHGNVSS